MKAFIDNITSNLTNEDFINNPFLYDEKALDIEVERYSIDNDILYYNMFDESPLEALDHIQKRNSIRELYNELYDFENLYSLKELKDIDLIISIIKKYKIFNTLTQYDYHSRFDDYFTDEDMRLIERNWEEN